MYKRRKGGVPRNICFACDGVENTEVGVIFHRLPKNPYFRSKWIELFHVDIQRNDLSKVYVCSKHFMETDYILRGDGYKRLRPGTLPFMGKCHDSDTVDEIKLTNVITSNDTLSDTESINISSIEHDHSYANDKILTFSESDEVILVDNEIEVVAEEIVIGSELTVDCQNLEDPSINSSSNDDTCSGRPETPTTPPSYRETQNKCLFNPRYIGDICEEHFSTPRRRRRTLSFIKHKYEQKCIELRTAKQHNRRLQVRFKTLKSLIVNIRNKRTKNCKESKESAESILVRRNNI